MGLLDREYMNRDRVGSGKTAKKVPTETYYKAKNFDVDFWNQQIKKGKQTKSIDKSLVLIVVCFVGAGVILAPFAW